MRKIAPLSLNYAGGAQRRAEVAAVGQASRPRARASGRRWFQGRDAPHGRRDACPTTCRFMDSLLSLLRMHWDHEPGDLRARRPGGRPEACPTTCRFMGRLTATTPASGNGGACRRPWCRHSDFQETLRRGAGLAGGPPMDCREGFMQKQAPKARRNSNIILWHPSWVRPPEGALPGGPAGAGPPATFYQPSGMFYSIH